MATPALDHAVPLRPGTSSDLDDVMAVMDAAFGDRFGEAWTRSQCAGILPMAGVSLIVARDIESGVVIGFSLSRMVAGEAELLLLAVVPRHQREGIGGLLLDDFMRRARAAAAARVHLEVREGNRAVEMYLRAGFTPVGRRSNYYRARNGKRFDALTLSQELST